MVAVLKNEGKADMVVIQKNRYILPGDKRDLFVQDLFMSRGYIAFPNGYRSSWI